MPADRAALAHRGLAIFFAVLIPFSAALEGWFIVRGFQPALGTLLLMFLPALAAIVARVTNHEGGEWTMFRIGGRLGLIALLESWLFPIAVGAIAYGTAWATGLAGFVAPTVVPLGASSHPIAQFLLLLVWISTKATIITCVFAAGEELGWRGYLLPRLVDARVPHPVVLSALIWAFWHVPLILGGVQGSGSDRLVSTVCFVVSISLIGVLMGRMRLQTGSLWPAVLLHGAWNAIIPAAYGRATDGANATLWLGEMGVLTTVAVAITSASLMWLQWRATAPPRLGQRVA